MEIVKYVKTSVFCFMQNTEISIFFIMNDKYQNTYSVSWEFVNYGNYQKKTKKINVINIKYF